MTIIGVPLRESAFSADLSVNRFPERIQQDMNNAKHIMPIYLDYHATTPVDPRVLEEMQPYFSNRFGNAASSTHAWGWVAEEAVTLAREKVAGCIGAVSREIVWTSGATESINMALKGVCHSYELRGKHIISCQTEHSSALSTLHYLESQGFHVTYLPVNQMGEIDLERLEKEITKETILISLMAANNEMGVIHPLHEIGKIAKAHGVFFHVDAAQACGKISMDVEMMGIDLLSASAHKFYGPKGVGFLYVRKRNPYVNLTPLIHGSAAHEGGLRGGTAAVPLIVGLSKALDIAVSEMGSETQRVTQLRKRLWKGLNEKISVHLNGHPANRLPGNLNVSFEGVLAADIISHLRDVALSAGSACSSSGSQKPSYVLKAMGLSDDRVLSSIRFGLGRFTTEKEIDEVLSQLVSFVLSRVSHKPS